MVKTKKTVTGSGANDSVHKGYNEKNPSQPQGAFKADSMDQKKKAPVSNKPDRTKKRTL